MEEWLGPEAHPRPPRLVVQLNDGVLDLVAPLEASPLLMLKAYRGIESDSRVKRGRNCNVGFHSSCLNRTVYYLTVSLLVPTLKKNQLLY